MLPRSTSSAEVAELPAAPSEPGACATPHHQASRRRAGRAQAEGSTGHVLLPCVELACGVAGGGVASDHEFTRNGEGGGAQVTIDVAALQQAATLAGAPMELATNRALVSLLSTCCRSIDGGATRYILTVGNADNAGEPKASVKQKYAKVLLSLYGVCLSACSAAFPVVKQAAPDGYLVLAYGLLVVLTLVLLVGLLATSFDGSPGSLVWGKYALLLALGLTIGLLTWSVCSLNHEPKLNVPIGIVGVLAYMVVMLLFHCRKW
ncbi:unnamed protein product [Urochloa humidicola]